MNIGAGLVANDTFGDDYIISGVAETGGSVDVRIRSMKVAETCPRCGGTSTRVHATYMRQIRDTPTRNKATRLLVRAKKFDCVNGQCAVKVFAERLPFAGRRQTRTHELTLMAMAVAIDMGNETASRALARIGVYISNDTLGRIYAGLEFEDDPFVEETGIDDVSNRRGATYLTVIYEPDSRRLLALLKGRDGESLREWLRAHLRVCLVARDRSSVRSAAIDEVLPDAVQVADRFHLIKNMLDYARDLANAGMPDAVFFVDGAVADKPPPTVAKPPDVDSALLDCLYYDDSPPVGDDGREVAFDGKNTCRETPWCASRAEV
jgi:transposase